jgi:drug/metabolite transporter (DMT)-like permease
MSDPTMNRRVMLWQGLALGLGAAAFFSVSFVLNRQMARADGHWAWSAALRFLMMLPVLAILITARRQWNRFWQMWRVSPLGWIVWGTLCCGVFYATLTAACAVSPAWVVAATWPVAIVIGILLGPVLYQGPRRYIPRKALLYSMIIVAGVLLLQVGQFRTGEAGNVVLGFVLVLVSATAHPIGNRKSMMLLETVGIAPNAILRVTLMIVGTLPGLLLLCLWGYLEAGLPSRGQLTTVGVVAAAGLIATPMFYAATDRVNRYPAALAAVEATQAAEIVFTLVFEALLLGIQPPDLWGCLGLACIALGMLRHATPKQSA